MLGFWKSSRSGRRGARSSSNSTPCSAADAGASTEGASGHARETPLQRQPRTTTADVTAAVAAAPRAGSVRGGSRPGSVRRSPIVDEKDASRPTAGASCRDQAVQTTDELLQPLLGDNGLRQRRRPAQEDAVSPVHGSLEDLASRPWRRHSLSSLSPLSPRLASPPPPAVDLSLEDVLGAESVRSLSPLSIAEMSSPPRRWPQASGGVFPLRCYDSAAGRGRRTGRAPVNDRPNYVFGLPPSPPPQRAPLKRQKPFLGAVRVRGPRPGRVEASPASSGSSGGAAAGGGRDSGSEAGGGAGGNKSLSTVSLEDALSRSMSRLSDDDDLAVRTAPPRRTADAAAQPPRDVARNDVARRDVISARRPPVVTSRRPVRPVVLSSDV